MSKRSGKHPHLKRSIVSQEESKHVKVEQYDQPSLDLRRLPVLDSPEERKSYASAIELCISQTENSDDVQRLIEKHRSIEKGKLNTLQYDELLIGYIEETLSTVPELDSEETFCEAVRLELQKFNQNDQAKCQCSTPKEKEWRQVYQGIVKLDPDNFQELVMQKGLYVLAAFYVEAIHHSCLQQKWITLRKLTLKKIKAIDGLIEAGLLTGTRWSYSPFWYSLHSELVHMYDIEPESDDFRGFTRSFLLLHQIYTQDKRHKKVVLNSVLHILETLSFFKNYNHSDDNKKRREKRSTNRRKISDRFSNLPEWSADADIFLFRPQRALE
jgi:hypothetical protein